MSATFGSLFSGCGGLDLGLELAGLTCVFQVEIDRNARSILERHWPNVRRHDDVRTFPPSAPDDWACDVLVGGDPCQENSRARIGDRTRAPSLGAEFIRVVTILRPSVVLRENPTRTRADAPWPWQRFRDELERLGYAVLPFRLRACCVGADHQRDRLFLLAATPDADRKHVLVSGRGATARTAGAMPSAASKRQWVRADDRAVVCDSEDRPDSGAGRGDARVPSRMDRLRCLGNAVDVRVARAIGERLVTALDCTR